MADYTTTMVDYVGDEGPAGASFGAATTSLRSAYGVTPIIQRSGGSQAAVSTTTIAPVTVTTPSGWTDIIPYLQSTVTAVNLLITRNASGYTLANELRASLVAFGIIAGA